MTTLLEKPSAILPNRWQGLQDDIEAKRERSNAWAASNRSTPKPLGPAQDAITLYRRDTGADILKFYDQLRTYTTRCRYAHNGVDALIKAKDPRGLAKQLWHDRKMLKNSPFYQTEDGRIATSALREIEHKYFAYVDEKQHGRYDHVFKVTWRLEAKFAATPVGRQWSPTRAEETMVLKIEKDECIGGRAGK